MVNFELKIMIKKNSKIFIAGHNGHLGSAIYRKLFENGYKNILTVEKKINLLDQISFNFIKKKSKFSNYCCKSRGYLCK